MTTTDVPPHSSARHRPQADGAARTFEPVFYLIGGALVLVAIATAIWGIKALALSALATVPLVFLGLLAVTRD
ncbi:MAG: hypothetical protein WCZ72_09045 [Gemmobacter sp.]